MFAHTGGVPVGLSGFISESTELILVVLDTEWSTVEFVGHFLFLSILESYSPNFTWNSSRA
jgi:hypothetical protein